MIDRNELENLGTSINTPEGKIAREVASQFIARKVGKAVKNFGIRKEVEVMLRLTNEIENLYDIGNICNRLNVNSDNASYVFYELSEEIFESGINWGRIIMLYAFAGKLAEHCKKTNNEHVIEKVSSWLGNAVSRKSSWIRESGNGWVGNFSLFKGKLTFFILCKQENCYFICP